MKNANEKQAVDQRPSARCYLEPQAAGPILKQVLIVNGREETPWVRDSEQGAKQMKAFCIGLLWAKFRSGYELSNPGWAELAREEGITWAKTLSENLCPSKRKHATWWNSGLKDKCPGGVFPFRLFEKPDRKTNCFRVDYWPSSIEVESCWAIGRLQLFDEQNHIIEELRLLAIARELEKSETNWRPILPSDEEVNTWPVRRRPAERDLPERASSPIVLVHASETRNEEAPGRDMQDQLRELNSHQSLFGRDWLFRLIDEFIAEPANDEGRYLVLIADPYFGKSAVAAEAIRRAQGLAAYYFIKRGRGDQDDTTTILLSLVAQLRERYQLRGLKSNQSRNVEGLFYKTLLEIGPGLATDEQVVIIIDGLDAAFGHGSRVTNLELTSAFPTPLPARCKVIFTSRQGHYLELINGVPSFKCVNLGNFSEESDREIQQWLKEQSQERGLGFDNNFVLRLADAAGGLFGDAVELLRPRDNLAEDLKHWRKAPDEIPRGLWSLCHQIWQRLLVGARREGISEADCRRFLGILASAREPLNWQELRTILLEVLDCDLSAPFSLPGVREAVQILGPFRLLQHGERIIQMAREFIHDFNFRDRRDKLVFAQESFEEFVQETLKKAGEQEMCRRILAYGCTAWRHPTLRNYALRNRFQYLFKLANWCPLFGRALGDLEFVEAACGEIKLGEWIHDKSKDALREIEESQQVDVKQWQPEFEEWAEFQKCRREWLPISARCYWQDVVNEFIHYGNEGQKTKPQKLRSVFADLESKKSHHRALFLRKIEGAPVVEDDVEGFKPHHVPDHLSDQDRVVEIGKGLDGRIRLSHCPEPWFNYLAPYVVGKLRAGVYVERMVTCSPDGNYIAAARIYEDSISVWRVSTGDQSVLFFPRRFQSLSFEEAEPPRLVVKDDLANRWVYEIAGAS